MAELTLFSFACKKNGQEVAGFTSNQLGSAATLSKVGSAIKAIVASMKY